jgi:hypothetical protein
MRRSGYSSAHPWQALGPAFKGAGFHGNLYLYIYPAHPLETVAESQLQDNLMPTILIKAQLIEQIWLYTYIR